MSAVRIYLCTYYLDRDRSVLEEDVMFGYSLSDVVAAHDCGPARRTLVSVRPPVSVEEWKLALEFLRPHGLSENDLRWLLKRHGRAELSYLIASLGELAQERP